MRSNKRGGFKVYFFGGVDFFLAALQLGAKLALILVTFYAGYLVSTGLQSYTDSALWLPKDFREIVRVLSTLVFAVGTLWAVIHIAKAKKNQKILLCESTDGKEYKKYSEEEKEEEKNLEINKAVFKTAIFLLGALLIIFGGAVWLRSACIYNFSPGETWWKQQYGDNHPPTNILTEQKTQNKNKSERIVAKSSLGRSTKIDDFSPGNSEKAQVERSKTYSDLPEFIDYERKIIFIPVKLDQKSKAYLKWWGDGDVKTGLAKTLEEEPDRVISWESGAWKNYRSFTMLIFLLFHSCLMVLAGACWGLVGPKVEGVFERGVEKLREFFEQSLAVK